MSRALRAMLMRGGTSKGLYIDARDVPADSAARDRLLLAVMGSPDIRQIDGMGGAHPLTSKVALVGPPTRPDADVDYLFLQVAVNRAEVSSTQNCGNLLAGVGPWAIERGLVAAMRGQTTVRIHMVNTASLAVARVQTPERAVQYDGDARIDGVPGTAAAVLIDFPDAAGSSCGALLPTGSVIDRFDGIEATCIDGGMPVVVLDARDFGLAGDELPAALEADEGLRRRIERIRLEAGPRMNLGSVERSTVPKMTLVAPAGRGGTIATRSFIPHRVHEAIGVLGAVSVAAACLLPGSAAARLAAPVAGRGERRLEIEHPSGSFTVELETEGEGPAMRLLRSAILRTARKLMDGEVFAPALAWPPA